jgi:hypothetical protein
VQLETESVNGALKIGSVSHRSVIGLSPPVPLSPAAGVAGGGGGRARVRRGAGPYGAALRVRARVLAVRGRAPRRRWVLLPHPQVACEALMETATLVRKGYGKNCLMVLYVLNNPVPAPQP